MAGELLLINPKRKRKGFSFEAAGRSADRGLSSAKRGARRGYRKAKKAVRRGYRAAKRTTRRTARKVSRVSRAYARRARTGTASFLEAGARALRGGGKRRRSRARKNPINLRGYASDIQQMIVPALIGGAGTVALDVLYAALPIPANLKSGSFAPLVKAGTVILAGELGKKVLPREPVEIAVGVSLAIIAANFIRAQVSAALPSLNMGAYVDYGYSDPSMGYANAAPFLPAPSPRNMSAYVGMDMGGTGGDTSWSTSAYGDVVS